MVMFSAGVQQTLIGLRLLNKWNENGTKIYCISWSQVCLNCISIPLFCQQPLPHHHYWL